MNHRGLDSSIVPPRLVWEDSPGAGTAVAPT